MRQTSYIVLFTVLFMASCSKAPVSFEKASFDDLYNWQGQNFSSLQENLQRNCPALIKRVGKPFYQANRLGSSSSWGKICEELKNISNEQAQAYFEENFQVLQVKSSKPSLFTGYYAPIVKGSYTKTATYNTPLYTYPSDIYTADLGLFIPELKGQRITLRVDPQTKKALPYYSRADISNQKAEALPFVWLDPVDAFFLHIQGSGFVELIDGTRLSVAYAGHNGHSYKAIGRTLIEKGYMKKEDVTLQSLSAWLKAHPEKQQEIFNTNPRYIFFKEGDGFVKGSLGLPLKAESSLAVDPNYIPLGVPLFVDTTLSYNQKPFKRFMFAEDTGAAIIGGVRGDIYFGLGNLAENHAGSQNAQGSLYILVPKQ